MTAAGGCVVEPAPAPNSRTPNPLSVPPGATATPKGEESTHDKAHAPSEAPAPSAPVPTPYPNWPAEDCPITRPSLLPTTGIDDISACPGEAATFVARGLPASTKLEIWLTNHYPRDCDRLPAEDGGTKLGEAVTSGSGDLTFEAVLPEFAEHPGRNIQAWAVFPGGEMIAPLAVFACRKPGAITGMLFDQEQRLVTEPLVVELRAEGADHSQVIAVATTSTDVKRQEKLTPLRR